MFGWEATYESQAHPEVHISKCKSWQVACPSRYMHWIKKLEGRQVNYKIHRWLGHGLCSRYVTRLLVAKCWLYDTMADHLVPGCSGIVPSFPLELCCNAVLEAQALHHRYCCHCWTHQEKILKPERSCFKMTQDMKMLLKTEFIVCYSVFKRGESIFAVLLLYCWGTACWTVGCFDENDTHICIYFQTREVLEPYRWVSLRMMKSNYRSSILNCVFWKAF